MFDWSKIWEENGIIEKSYYANLDKTFNDAMYLFKEISKGDSFLDILIYPFHSDYNNNGFQYNTLKDIMDSYKGNIHENNTLEIYISFDSWEDERKIVNNLKSSERNAIARNKIENDFGTFHSVYFSKSNFIELKIDQDGINFLESPKCPENNISAVVVNCSFSELKKLYNLTGAKLFKNNVRDGIVNSKSEIKSIFSQYLSVSNEEIESEEDFIQGESKIRDFSTELFWFSHNGITLFIDKNVEDSYSFKYDKIRINTKSCSVINGAQTITNFFLAYSELKNTYEINDEKEKIIRLEELLSNLFVKLTIIVSDVKYSPFITKGLNTQIPISMEDFIAISKEVEEINKVALGYIYILKTGQFAREGGVSPLQFVKQYLIATSSPGTAKNFNKNDLEKTIKKIHEKLIINQHDSIKLNQEEKEILEKISYIPYIENWWNKKNREKSIEKDLIDNYGKNYFQSFVLDFYKSNVENKVDLIDIFHRFKKLIENQSDVNFGSFKNDDLYKIIKEENYTKLREKSTVTDFELYTKSLKEHLEKLCSEPKIDYQKEIINFNELKKYDIINLKVITIQNGKIKAPLYLSSQTFKSIYQGLNIEERLKTNNLIQENDFVAFDQSTLFKELNQKYNIIVLDFIDDKLERIKLFNDFKFNILEASENKVEEIYQNTIKAFINGDVTIFLKDKCSSVICTKEVKNADYFVFSTGEKLVERSFCITDSYLESTFLTLFDNK